MAVVGGECLLFLYLTTAVAGFLSPYERATRGAVLISIPTLPLWMGLTAAAGLKRREAITMIWGRVWIWRSLWMGGMEEMMKWRQA